MVVDIRAYLELMRIPNVFTAMADILAGYFIASPGNVDVRDVGLLLVSSSFLYTGGIVLNDFFDYEVDKVERPERPLPSGRIKRGVAGILGWGLLVSGITVPLLIGRVSFGVALGIVLLVLSYDSLTKGVAVIGPLTIGLCRYMNFVLGMSPFLFGWNLKLAVPGILMVYIIILTVISLGESKNLKARSFVKWMLLGIIPMDSLIAMSGAGLVHGAIVLMLLIPAYISSRLLDMT